tara:strand:+ start:76 stop:201 length:126 start_codon:yes stop_codon:yes gene_type:complete
MELENLMAHFMTIIAIIPFVALGLAKVVDIRKNKELYRVKS